MFDDLEESHMWCVTGDSRYEDLLQFIEPKIKTGYNIRSMFYNVSGVNTKIMISDDLSYQLFKTNLTRGLLTEPFPIIHVTFQLVLAVQSTRELVMSRPRLTEKIN